MKIIRFFLQILIHWNNDKISLVFMKLIEDLFLSLNNKMSEIVIATSRV